MKIIFVVDDGDTYLSMAEKALDKPYRVMTMPSTEKIFSFLKKITPIAAFLSGKSAF
jgi:hypothetical protein